jgi:uncharacterized repeat protein (TIGR04138 family)
MTQDRDFAAVIKDICKKDSRYDRDAYFFVRESLDFTSKTLNKPREGTAHHITGPELLEGIRCYALQEFGPLALTALNSWGIRNTLDFGEIVFNLVETGKLGKTSEDKKEDFANGYDFQEVFAKPFLPTSVQPPAGTDRKKTSRRRKTPTRKGN